MIFQSLQKSWRSLWLPQHRGFAIASVLTLALGIGAVTTIWTMVHAVLYAPLPFHQQDEVVFLAERHDETGVSRFSVSLPNLRSWQQADTGIEEMAGLLDSSVNLNLGGEMQRLSATATSSDIWHLLGIPVLAGRAFDQTEQRSGAVVLISERLWRQRFASDPAILGRKIELDGQSRTVIGVAPQDMGWTQTVDIWLPLQPYAGSENRGNRRLTVLARLAPGVSLEQARVRLDALAGTLEARFPDDLSGWRTQVFAAKDWIVSTQLTQQLQLLLAAVVLILLVACTNVANLNIARAAKRSRELGVRRALGASRWRLFVDQGLESTLLVAIGAVLGLALAWLSVQAIVALLPSSTPRIVGVGLHAGSATIAIVCSMGTALLFSLLPAWRAQSQSRSSLLSGGRGNVDTRRAGLRRTLVVAQFALATMLAVGAIQLLQQLVALQNAAVGYQASQVVTARLALPEINDEAALEQQRAGYNALLTELRAQPNVQAAGITNEIPHGEIDTQMGVSQIALDKPVQASWRIVTGGYLQAMSIPLLVGRSFAENNEAADSVLLSYALASKLWTEPAQGIGRWVRLSNGQVRNVVGIVGDVRQRDVADTDTPTMYFPTTWYLWPTMVLAVRTTADPMTLAPVLRAAAARVFPQQPMFDIRSMQAVFDQSIATPRLQTVLIVAFAIAGLLLAAIGISGVMSFLVAQRAPEFALRLALGAAPKPLMRRVIGDAALLSALGVLLGGVLLLGIIRAMDSITIGAAVQVSVSAVLSVLLLLATGIGASWLPARRVLRMDASAALRGD